MAVKKPRMISMRLTEEQFQDLEQMIAYIETETGTKVTKSSLIIKLIEFGKPILQDLYPRSPGVVSESIDSIAPIEHIVKKKRFKFFN